MGAKVTYSALDTTHLDPYQFDAEFIKHQIGGKTPVARIGGTLIFEELHNFRDDQQPEQKTMEVSQTHEYNWVSDP